MYQLLQVDHRLIEKFNIVAEVIPVIKEYITEVGIFDKVFFAYNLVTERGRCAKRKIHFR